MKKLLALILSGVLCVTMAAGCGKKAEEPGKDTEAATEAAGGDSSNEQVTIEYWQYYFESKVNLIDELIEEFEAENPGIKVVHQNFPYDNYEQKLAASMAVGGGGPNIINIFYGWVPKYVKSGALQELPTDAFDPAELDSDFSPMVQVNKINGKYYTIPTAVRTSALFYNKNLLDAAGMTVPQSWLSLRKWREVWLSGRETRLLLKDVPGSLQASIIPGFARFL